MWCACVCVCGVCDVDVYVVYVVYVVACALEFTLPVCAAGCKITAFAYISTGEVQF